MCSPIKCPNCGKITWTGCGRHVAQLKAQVPDDQWCTCRGNEEPTGNQSGFFANLFGR